jgi:hypothetical protein
MFKSVPRVLVLLVMLIAFAGQAVAFNSYSSCETPVDSLSHDANQQIKHDDSSPIKADNSEDCCGIECCDLDCTCIANACSSYIYFNTDVNPTKSTALSEVAYVQHTEQPKSIPALLYRPPIFTS